MKSEKHRDNSFRTKHAQRRLAEIVAHLGNGAASARDMAAHFDTDVRTLAHYIAHLRTNKTIHISHWEKNVNGPRTPWYALGDKEDAPLPHPVRTRSYEDRKAARAAMARKELDEEDRWVREKQRQLGQVQVRRDPFVAALFGAGAA